MAVIDYTNDIQKLYVAYFNRPADYEGLAFWNTVLNNNGGNLAFVSATFAKSPEYAEQNAGKSYFQIVNQIYQNLFNRDADVQGLEFWAARLREGTFTVDQIVKVIADNASDTDAKDKTTYENKVAAAKAFSAELNTAAEIIGYTGNAANNAAKTWLSTVSTTASLNAAIAPTALASTVASVAAVGLQSGGKASALTTGVDTLTGTSGTDVFTGIIDGTTPANSTFTALDTIDGGAGIDVLNISSIGDFAVPGGLTISNVEQVQVTASGKVGAFAANGTGASDLSVSMANVAELTISKAAEADFKAGSATAVKVVNVVGGVEVVGGASQNVSSANQAAEIKLSGSTGAITVNSAAQVGAINVDGGSTVNVAATSKASNGAINVGATAQSTGAVNVTSNLNSDGVAAFTGGAINVKGGSTVNVAVNATSVAKDQTASEDISIGAIGVTGDGKTTSVTVTQADTATAFTKAAVAAVKETSVVTFGAMKSGETLIINGLTFTASKDLPAEQAAAAFANLTAADTQSATGPVANGYYTGTFSAAGWTSGAASGKTVTFTAKDEDETDLTFTGTAATADSAARVPTQVKTAGTPGTTKATSANEIAYGAVTINDAATAAITTVTLNGYGTANIGTTTALNALKTISLANSDGAATIASSATTLGLTVNNVNDAVAIGATTATLNVTTTGEDSAFALTGAGVKDLNIAGDHSVDLSGSALGVLENVTVTGSAGATLTAAASKSVNTTGTSGGVTAVITGATATYTGGAGKDNVTVNGVATKAINLGAGDDTLTVTSSTAMTVEANGGEGTDTLIMSAVDAENASKASTFEAKITSFEKLQVNAVANGATNTVDMSNMDDINYIISAGTNAVAQKSTVTITGATDNAADTVSVDVGGKTFTVTGAYSATAAATALAALIDAETAYIASAANGVVTITAAATGTPFTVTNFTAVNNGSPADTAASTDADTAAADATTAQVTEVTVTGGVNNVADQVTLKVGGTAFTIPGALTAADIATALAAAINADAAYNATAAAGVITITAAAVNTAFAVDALAVTNNGGVPDTVAGAIATTAASGGIAGTLALTKVAADATLELTGGAVTGTSVELADATGTADVLKVVTKVGAANVNYGTLTAEGVETINITATDTAATTINTSTLTLKDAALKSVVVTGNGALDLALDANVVALTSVDGTAMTGSLTATTNGVVGQTIKGGSGDDVLTSKATGSVADRLEGGAGNDSLFANKGMTMMLGGAGKDTFNITVASTNVNSAATIGDLGSGDVIKFAGADAFKSAAISLDTTAVFQDFANAAIASITSANDLAWFQFGGNTYIVQEKVVSLAGNESNDSVFVNGEDFIVKITGTVDLSTASFNTAGILEIA